VPIRLAGGWSGTRLQLAHAIARQSKLHGSTGVASICRCTAAGLSTSDNVPQYENEGAVGDSYRRSCKRNSKNHLDDVTETANIPGLLYPRIKTSLLCEHDVKVANETYLVAVRSEVRDLVRRRVPQTTMLAAL